MRKLSLVFLLALLTACSSTTQPVAHEHPVGVLYERAMNEMANGEYGRAAKEFDQVDLQHPYSPWANKAQIMSAFASYRGHHYDEAIVAAQRYIQLHRGDKDVAYAYYLVANCYYDQIIDVGRDQRTTELALKALEEVVRRFPKSPYARDARLKIGLARDHLAGKDMAIGRFYERRGEYIAAIGRFRTVVVKYQTTTQVPEALERLTECYLALGITDEAETAAAVLGHNFPGSPWYARAYQLLTGAHLTPVAHQGSWLSKAWHTIL